MSRHKFLSRLPSEDLAKRHQMNADADALAKRAQIPYGGSWIAGCGIQPSHPDHKRVMGKVF